MQKPDGARDDLASVNQIPDALQTSPEIRASSSMKTCSEGNATVRKRCDRCQKARWARAC
eukprot:5423531-Pleurochrysis_carterae.AAC.1